MGNEQVQQILGPKAPQASTKRDLDEAEQSTVNFGGIVTTAAPGGLAGMGIGIGFVQICRSARQKLRTRTPKKLMRRSWQMHVRSVHKVQSE